MLRCWIGIGAAAVLVAAVGCGGGASSVKTVPVRGKVTLDGKPVEGATVQFAPEEGSGGRAASGLTKSDGTFELTTVGGGAGAVPGKYKVAITKRATTGPAQAPKSQEEAMKAIQEQMAKGGSAAFIKAPPKIQDELPARLSSHVARSRWQGDGEPRVRVGGGTWPIDPGSGHPEPGRPVVVGVRPEHLLVAPADTEGGVDAVIVAVEWLGHERHLVCDVGGSRLTVREPTGRLDPEPGRPVRLRARADSLQLFDEQTGERWA